MHFDSNFPETVNVNFKGYYDLAKVNKLPKICFSMYVSIFFTNCARESSSSKRFYDYFFNNYFKNQFFAINRPHYESILMFLSKSTPALKVPMTFKRFL